jgi:SSS family solute:Na+ symporter
MINAIVVLVYLMGVVALGVYLSRFVRGEEDYFLAGRSLNKWVIAGSIMSTNVAAIYLVGPAGAAYGGGGVSTLLIAWTGNMIAAVSALFFVPRLRRMRITTISEFLEQRYGVALRLLPSGLWMLYYACFAGVGMCTLATVLGPVLNIEPRNLILFVGLAVLAYCFSAGLIGAAYSSVVEAFIMVLGGLILLPLVLKQVGGLSGLYETLSARGDASYFVFWKAGSAGVWPTWKDVVMFIMLGLPYWCTSQYMVQRSFAGRSVREASRGVILAALMTGPLTLSYIIPGICGSVLYTGDAAIAGDTVLPRLLNDFIPVGLGGLFLAALVAASNSTSSALLSSLATLSEHDFYRRFVPGKGSRHYMLIGRIATLIGGIVGMVFALRALEGGIIRTAYDLMGFFEPPIFVIVAAALFWKRANTCGAAACGIVGIGFNFWARFGLKMGAAEQTMLCFPICAIVIVMASLLWGATAKGKTAAAGAQTLFTGWGTVAKPEPGLVGRLGVIWAAVSLVAFVAASFGEAALPKPGSVFIYMGLMLSFVFGCYLAVPAFLPESDEDATAESALSRSMLQRLVGSGWSWLALYGVSIVLMVVLYVI